MIICISPSKTLDESTGTESLEFTMPEFLEHSQKLVNKLRKLSANKLKSLMNISDSLAKLNRKRFDEFQLPFTSDNAKQCVLMFKGDVYEGLDANDFDTADFEFAQKHLRILSGLYGSLKPLDLMQPYRLEMGTSIGAGRKRNLYDFWSDKVTDHIKEAVTIQAKDSSGESDGARVVINLASKEYFKVVNEGRLNARVITPVFKEERDGGMQMISFFAKKARGLLARHIIKNRLTHPDQLLSFDSDGYRYNADVATDDFPVFTRKS